MTRTLKGVVGVLLVAVAAGAIFWGWSHHREQMQVNAILAALKPLLATDTIPAQDNYRKRLKTFDTVRGDLEKNADEHDTARAQAVMVAAQPLLDALHDQLSETADWLDQLTRLSNMRGAELLASGDIGVVAQQLRSATQFYSRYNDNLQPRNRALVEHLEAAGLSTADRDALLDLWKQQQPPADDPKEPRALRLRKLALLLDASANLFEFVAQNQVALRPVDTTLPQADQDAAKAKRIALGQQLFKLTGALNNALITWTQLLAPAPGSIQPH